MRLIHTTITVHHLTSDGSHDVKHLLSASVRLSKCQTPSNGQTDMSLCPYVPLTVVSSMHPMGEEWGQSSVFHRNLGGKICD